MIGVLRSWYNKHFSDPQAVILTIVLVGGFSVILMMGEVLTPIIAAIVIAYVLEGLVKKLQRVMPHLLAVSLVVTLFVFAVLIVFLGLVPFFSKQLSQFFVELPNMLARGQQALMMLPEKYPFISEIQIQELMTTVQTELATLGQKVVSISLSSVVDVFTLLVYMVVVPLLVFFFLKDKTIIIGWSMRFLPRRDGLASEVWYEVE